MASTWYRGFTENPLGRRSEEQLAHPRQAVRAHDDEVGRGRCGNPEDFLGGLADGDLVQHVHPDGRRRIEYLRGDLTELLASLLGIPHDSRTKVERLGQQRVLNAQQDQLRAEVLGDRCSVSESGAARLGEIDGTKDRGRSRHGQLQVFRVVIRPAPQT